MSTPVIKKKVAVIGSRDFEDKRRLYDILTKNYDRIKLIISGGARGADSLAVAWAADYGIPYLVFPAMWHNPFTGEHDKGAGFRRNVQIIDQCDVVIAFWDGKSSGTAHSIETAGLKQKPVKIYKFGEEEAKTEAPKKETVPAKTQGPESLLETL